MGNGLIAIGMLLILAGLASKFGLLSWFGQLPGDLRYEGEHFMIFIPFSSMIVLSVFLSILLWLFNHR